MSRELGQIPVSRWKEQVAKVQDLFEPWLGGLHRLELEEKHLRQTIDFVRSVIQYHETMERIQQKLPTVEHTQLLFKARQTPARIVAYWNEKYDQDSEAILAKYSETLFGQLINEFDAYVESLQAHHQLLDDPQCMAYLNCFVELNTVQLALGHLLKKYLAFEADQKAGPDPVRAILSVLDFMGRTLTSGVPQMQNIKALDMNLVWQFFYTPLLDHVTDDVALFIKKYTRSSSLPSVSDPSPLLICISHENPF